MNEMFCSQCQETASGTGCTMRGVCGKTADVANLQDLIVYLDKGLSLLNDHLRRNGSSSDEVDRFIVRSLFMTITNANFDKQRIVDTIYEGLELRDDLKQRTAATNCGCSMMKMDALNWTARDEQALLNKARTVGILNTADEDIRALRQLVVLGCKGMAAYYEHASNLGFEDEDIVAFMQQALAATLFDQTRDELTDWVLHVGRYGVKVMELLDKANTHRYGNPEITKVNIGVRHRPGILVSGHDLRDLEDLLVESEDEGVDVYTHSEMLPAHYYPFFKRFPHFVGNYGNAWHLQTKEFETFNGPILFTTNCIVPPRIGNNYADRIFTTGAAGFVGFPHIPDREEGRRKDFSTIIRVAKGCEPPAEIENGSIVGGFAHNQVLALADQIVDAVRNGHIRKFVVMAGCDGRMPSRSYYTQFAQQLPQDTVILTAGCAKYRYNKLPLGSIDGIPRVLDAGQCNDSYSLALIALTLKDVFNAQDINDLPIVYNISWYEQKAVIVLLSLLSLGIHNIHLGPTLPGFLSPNIANYLVNTFGLGTISSVDEDIMNWM